MSPLLCKSPKSVIAGLTLSLIITLAGCSTGANSGINSDDGETPIGLSEEAEATPISPLAEFMGSAFGAEMSRQEQLQQQEADDLRREELIAQCMSDAGFEYHIRTVTDSVAHVAGDGEAWQPEDLDWVSQNGYGLISMGFATSGDSSIGVSFSQTDETDPNMQYMLSLSPAEFAAYQLALWGIDLADDTGNDGVMEINSADIENMGCWGSATMQLNSSNPLALLQTEEFTPLFEAVVDLQMALPNDPDMMELEREWSNCMANAGHQNFSAQAQAQMQFAGEFIEFINNWDTATQGIPDPATNAEYAALRDREIELATDDLNCRIETDYRNRQNAVTFAAESQFIEDNRAALEAFEPPPSKEVN